MSVQTEIDRISGNVDATYKAAEELGANLPAEQNSDNLPGTIRAIPTAEIVQETGSSETAIMSQAAATRELNKQSEEIADKVPKNQGAENVGKILAVGTDGNLTLVDMPEGGVTGDVTGVLDESNNLLLSGNIADGTYPLKWLKDDGTWSDAGNLIVSSITDYAINATLENCTSSGATSVRANGSATVTVTANSGYALPDSITVSGASYTWDKSTGKIVLSNPTSDVNITVTAVKAITNFAEYNADNTTDFNIWINEARIGSDGGYRADTFNASYGTPAVSNYIAVQNGDVIETEGMYLSNKMTCVYNASKGFIAVAQPSSMGNYFSYNLNGNDGYNAQLTINNSNVAYIRIGGYYTDTKGIPVIKIKRNGEYL